MKKRTIVLILVILAVVLFAWSRNDFRFSGISSSYVYADAERYTAGGGKITDTVEKIDLSWIDGEVDVAYHDGDGIVISEKAGNLDEDKQLHWLVEDDTLYIKYAASGARMDRNLNKALSVKLPKEIKLDNVIMNVVSSDVQVHELSAEKISIHTVSGDAEGLFTQADEVSVNTVSGTVSMSAKQVDAVAVSTVSGNAAFRFETAPKKVSIDSVSGDATLYLPENVGFYAEMDSVSGKVSGSLPMEQKEKKTYVSGDEACRIDISSVSGDVKLDKLTK